MRVPLIRSSILLKDFSAIATASKTSKNDFTQIMTNDVQSAPKLYQAIAR